MENSFLELQKKFNLFAKNSVVRGTIVSADGEKLNIKLIGGAMAAMTTVLYQSYEQKGVKLKAGRGIEGIIVDIIDGIPYLTLSERFILTNKPQKAFVKISGPQGIVVGFEFDENIIGFYQSDKPLAILTEKTPVICSNLTKEKDYYKIGKLEEYKEKTAPETEKPISKKPTTLKSLQELYKMPKDLPNEYIKDHLSNSNCCESREEFRLGKCYIAKRDAHQPLVILRDNIKGQVTKSNGHDPKSGDNLLVRIVNISTFGQIEVEILDVPNKEYVLWFYEQREKEANPQDKKPSKIKNGFDFSEQDKKLFATAMNNGSIHQFHQYWLGHLYEVPIKNGAPFFETRAVPFIKVKLIDWDIFYQEGDIVYARLHFIEEKGETVTFTVQVEYAEQSN